jgi:hypothetical protein
MDTNNPWARPAEEVLADLGVPADTGLTKAEAFERRRRFGPAPGVRGIRLRRLGGGFRSWLL